MPNKLNIYKKIPLLRKRFLKASIEKTSLVQMINETEVSEHVYNSNAIENSTLTLEETEKILLQIDLDRYITERELFEAKNLARVVSYITTKATQSPLTIDMMLYLHKMLLSNIRDDIAGRIRRDGEYVRVGMHIAPPSDSLMNRLTNLLIHYESTDHEHIVKRIATAHLEFEHIHPFIDGNGRIGRVINNYLLIRNGFVPINIKYVDQQKYYHALRAYDHNQKSNIMEEIIGLALTNSYHKRLAYLDGKKIVTLNEFSKETKQSYSNLINKANRQTIDAFLEKGVWKIGL